MTQYLADNEALDLESLCEMFEPMIAGELLCRLLLQKH